jgi:hypothetical protein
LTSGQHPCFFSRPKIVEMVIRRAHNTLSQSLIHNQPS